MNGAASSARRAMPLQGKTFLFTGTLEEMTRDEAKELGLFIIDEAEFKRLVEKK